MKTFCLRLALITSLMLLGSLDSHAMSPGEGNGSPALPDTSHANTMNPLWRIACAAPGGIGTIENGTLVLVNDYITKMLGYSRQELQGSGERILYADDNDYALVQGMLRDMRERGEALSMDTRWKTKTGRVVDVHLLVSPLEPGNPAAGLIYMAHDITERKRAETALRRRARFIHAGAVAGFVLLGILLFLLARKQKRLRLSQRELMLFKEAVESSTDAIGMSTPQGCHYYQNRAFDELFGSVGESPAETLYVDPALGSTVFKTIMAGGQWTGEVKMYGRDRSVLDVFVRAYANKDTHGRIISLVGIHTNITESRQAAAALRESEQKVSNILDTVDDVVMSFSLKEKRLVYQSPSLEKIFGLKPEDQNGNMHPWMDAVHPDDFQAVNNGTALLAEQGFSDDEFRIIRPDGSIAWVRSRAKVIYDATGAPERIDRVISDITERKLSEFALRESEAKLAALFSSMTEMVVINDLVFDEQGNPVNYRMSDCNRAFTEITGIEREDAVGRLADDLYGTDKPPYFEEFSRVALTGEPCRFETYFAPMQKHFAVSVVCPGPNRFATITSDITTRRHSEEVHERLQAQLSQAQKIESIGRLAGGVAHDFNNILSVIMGYTDMALQHVGEDHHLRCELLEIRRAVERSSKLTRQLLAFARKQVIAPRVLDLNATVEEMLRMLRRLIGEDIDLAWLPGKGLLPVKIDPSQLDQVLANLCVNSRDAIADVGRIIIETANVTLGEDHCVRHPDSSPGDYVMLAVSDTGSGMDSETLDNIFEPFFTTKDIGTGTGLGLSTVYGIVKQNNGCIEVVSEPGQGTRFIIYLPPHTGAMGEGLDSQSPDRPLAHGTETVLLAEDEPANLEMYGRMLTRLGYAVIPTSNPHECLRLAREHTGRVDLLLTDVVMPGMNGPDLAKSLLEDNPGLKCLFMSGYTDKAFNHQGVLEPGIHFIQKPFSLGELADKIRHVLDSSSA